MQRLRTARMLLVAGVLLGLAAEPARAVGRKQDRDEIRDMARETLAELYRIRPEAKAAVENAAGYAVFSNVGLKILVAGTGKGQGLAVEKETGRETFMKMLEVQAGLGFGAKRFRLVWVFETKAAFQDFVDKGWEFGAQSTVAAKRDDQGAAFAGALAVNPDVWLYQITDKGLALELTAKGTKYFKDKDLN